MDSSAAFVYHAFVHHFEGCPIKIRVLALVVLLLNGLGLQSQKERCPFGFPSISLEATSKKTQGHTHIACVGLPWCHCWPQAARIPEEKKPETPPGSSGWPAIS